MKKLVLPLVCASVAAAMLAGCFSAEPTPPGEPKERAKNALLPKTKLIVQAYDKVLKEEEVNKLNECVAGDIAAALSKEEQYVLAGNTMEQAQYKDALKPLTEKLKPTSKEFKNALKTCSVSMGVAKLIEKVK